MKAEQVGLGHETEVGLLDVEWDSCIVILPSGDVELFTADKIADHRLEQAQRMRDGVMLFVNDAS